MLQYNSLRNTAALSFPAGITPKASNQVRFRILAQSVWWDGRAQESRACFKCGLLHTVADSWQQQKALLDLTPSFSEGAREQPAIPTVHTCPLPVGRLQQCRTWGKASRGRREQNGNQGSSGISMLLSKICTDSLTHPQPPLQLPTHSFHSNHDNCFPKCHKISLLKRHIGAARSRTTVGMRKCLMKCSQIGTCP